MESLHRPNHPTLLGSIHLTLLYYVLRICWAQSPVLDAEELGTKELALQKVTIWSGPCEAIEDSPAGARKALSNRRTERSDPGGQGTDLKGWVHGEERRGCLGGGGGRAVNNILDSGMSPKVPSRAGRLRWGSSVGAVGGGWKGRLGCLESDPAGLTMVKTLLEGEKGGSRATVQVEVQVRPSGWQRDVWLDAGSWAIPLPGSSFEPLASPHL